eukprot:2077644-Pleurochrysis_carterae.AAC.1
MWEASELCAGGCSEVEVALTVVDGNGVRVGALSGGDAILVRSVDFWGDASRASEARGRSEATARAMTKFRSGGYAAANCDVQAP